MFVVQTGEPDYQEKIVGVNCLINDIISFVMKRLVKIIYSIAYFIKYKM